MIYFICIENLSTDEKRDFMRFVYKLKYPKSILDELKMEKSNYLLLYETIKDTDMYEEDCYNWKRFEFMDKERFNDTNEFKRYMFKKILKEKTNEN